jgi:hypothetical protein
MKYYLGDQIKRRERHVAHMDMRRDANRISVVRPEGMKPLGRSRHGWEDNINMNVQELEWVGMDWIDLAKDRDSWRAVNAVMNLDSIKCGKF